MTKIKLAAAGTIGLVAATAAWGLAVHQGPAPAQALVAVHYSTTALQALPAAYAKEVPQVGARVHLASDEPDEDLRSFEDYADDDGIVGQRDERGWGRGRDRWDDDGPRRPRGGRPEMMGPRAMGGMCGPNAGRRAEWMLARLERIVNPTEQQRAAFDKLRDAGMRAQEIVRASCPAERPLTPPGRLAAAEKRLEAMLQAVRLVRPPMDELFAMLSEEQKARLYAFAPRPYGHYRGGRDGPGRWDGPPRERGRDGWRGRGRDDDRRGRPDDDDDGARPNTWRGRL